MTVGLDQLANAFAALGPVGTGLALAAVPVVAGAAVYVTRMGSQARIDRLEGELDQAKTKQAEDLTQAQQKYAALDDKYQAMLRSGALLQVQLDAIISEVAEIADRLDATDYSVLVPAPSSIPGDTPDQLVFLCASGSQSAKLRWVRVPISSSLSGAVYLSGKATIASPPSSSAAFASRTDKITDYTTNEALSVCLRYKNQHVGIAQFLNRRGGRFGSADTDRAVALCTALAVRVGDFMADPRKIIELGHAPRQNQHNATIMITDLSNYAELFKTLDVSVITDLLNQYFQDLCTIAIGHGATIDQFMGDGILLIFRAGQSEDPLAPASITAAREMRAAFRDLRQRWTTLGYLGTDKLRVRFGLSCGLVTRVEIGHAQARRITVIGPAVNAAAHTCDAAPRDRDTICVTDEIHAILPPNLQTAAKPIAAAKVSIFELSV
jgi:class 3 adenylate cyclase